MQYLPRPHQQVGERFLLSQKRCNLWAAPGMGKTAIVLSWLDVLYRLGSAYFPALVIAPKRVALDVWKAEIEKWDDFRHLRVSVICGEQSSPEARAVALRAKADIYIINYDNIVWLANRYSDPASWPFRIVIADESTRLKNFRTRQGGVRARALSKIAGYVGRWVNLTGTPATNGYADLWGQQWFVDQGEALGLSYARYLERWFVKGFDGFSTAMRTGVEAEIQRAIAPTTLSLRPEDWFPVDQPVFQRIEVKLPPEAMKLYRRMERDFYVELERGEITALNSVAQYTKLLQMASGAVYDETGTAQFVHDFKIQALRDLVNELNGEPLIVCYHYKSTLAALREAFSEAVELRDDKRTVERWNRGEIPVLLLHPQSGGHGLNLQDGGRAIAFLTNTADMELRLQAIGRIDPVRQQQSGHPRSVLVYDIVASGTIDEDVLDVQLAGKEGRQKALIGALVKRHAA